MQGGLVSRCSDMECKGQSSGYIFMVKGSGFSEIGGSGPSIGGSRITIEGGRLQVRMPVAGLRVKCSG